MADFTVSPNMNLSIPTVGEEAGPQYATDINNSLNTIDSHNHSAGSGVLITPSGLNINADLPMNGNNLTLINTNRFISLSGTLANTAPNIGCIYVSGNELYYNDYSGGNIVPITNNGNVNAGAGSIGGLPSGTASVNYTASTYVFQSATTVSATIDVGSVILRNTTASSNGVTLQAVTALGSNYTLTLPLIPAQTNVMTLSSAGNMGSVTWDAVGQNMTSVGADAIAASMDSTGTNAIIATMGQTGANAIAANTNNPNFGGKAAQEDGLNIVVSNTNATNSLCIVRGVVSAAGAIVAGEGFTVSTNTPGANDYTVLFTTNFGDIPGVTVTAVGSPGNTFANIIAGSPNSTGFSVFFGTASGPSPQGFSFIAIGQRP